jgi:hypothetical protein
MLMLVLTSCRRLAHLRPQRPQLRVHLVGKLLRHRPRFLRNRTIKWLEFCRE